MFSYYVFVWATIMGSCCILLLHLLLKNTRFLIHSGIRFFFTICAFAIFRLIVPVEFPEFQYVYEYPPLLSAFFKDIYLFHGRFSLIQLMIAVSFLISIILFIRMIRNYMNKTRSLFHNSMPAPDAEIVLRQCIPDCDLSVRYKDFLYTPLIAGSINPIIYLPNRTYSAEQLEHIFSHEYTHWIHHHHLIRYVLQALACIFWWNPFIYMFQKDVIHIIELSCDDIVTQEYPSEEKLSYLDTIIHCLMKAKNTSDIFSKKIHDFQDSTLGFAADPKSELTVQRFSYLIERDQYLSDQEENPIVSPDRRVSKLVSTVMNHGYVCMLYLFSICCIIASYYLIAQPAFEPAETEIYSNSHNAYLVEQEDGSYDFHYKNTVSNVMKYDVEHGYYSIYMIIPYKEYAHLKDYKKSPTYKAFLKLSSQSASLKDYQRKSILVKHSYKGTP